MNKISFRAASGASELSANAFVLEALGVRVLLDAGAPQQRPPGWVDQIARPEVCWISHVHWDHMGALAGLRERFPRLACLSTPTTRRLAGPALALGGVEQARARALGSQLQALPSRQYFELSRLSDNPQAEKFRLMAFPAGHIPGAAMLLVEIDRGPTRPFRLLYTGDFCGHDQPLCPGALFPRTGADFGVDVLVMEGVLATNKACDQVRYAEQLDVLVEAVADTRGPVLVGVATVGSAFSVVEALREAGQAPLVHEMIAPVLQAAGVPADDLRFGSDAACERALGAGGVVVAPGEQFDRSSAAGRLVGGVVERPQALVAVINRAHASSVAGRLVGARRGDTLRLGGRAVAVRARIEHVLLPNHAPRRQLIAAVDALAPERVVLVHGHRSQLFSLKRAIARAGYAGPIDVPDNAVDLMVG